MADEDICNNALGIATQDFTIVNINENSVPAKRMRRFFSVTRKYLLSMFCWSFASRPQSLVRSDVESSSDYAFVYKYPSGALRIWSVLPAGGKDYIALEEFQKLYQFETFLSADGNSKEIHSNVELAKCMMTFDLQNSDLFSPTFSEAFACLLALKYGHTVSIAETALSRITSLYSIALSTAKEDSAMESKTSSKYGEDYIEDRS